MTITRKIHQIWLQGEENMPLKYREYSKKYRELNEPYGWSYKLWDEKSIKDLIQREYPEFLDIFNNYPFWVMRVDLGKYCILHSEGGLVVDTDTEPVDTFEKIMGDIKGKPAVVYHPKKGGIIGTNFHFLENIFVHRITNNNFIYLPYPRHPFSSLLLQRAKCTATRMPYDFKLYYVLASIGPLFLIDTIEEFGPLNISWIPVDKMNQIFLDERANSWNKKHYDTHDIFWGTIFLGALLWAIYCCYKTYKLAT